MSLVPVAPPDLAVLTHDQLSRPGGYLVGLYLSSLRSPASRASMRASLRAVTQVVLDAAGQPYDPGDVGPDRVDWAGLDWAGAAAVKTAMRETAWAPATINRHLAAVRGVVKVAHLVGLMDADRAARCRTALQGEPLSHDGVDPAGRLVTHRELRAMFDVLALDGSLIAARDAAALAVLSMGGLRRSELVALDVADWRPESGELIVRCGKGGRARKVWLHGGAAAAVQAWLDVRGDDPGPLLLAVRRGGHVVAGESGRMSDHAVWKRVKSLAARAGIPDLAPHDFRRKVITDLLDHGVDLAAAQQLAGHRNISTTAGYDRRGERAAHRASLTLDVPYVAPV